MQDHSRSISLLCDTCAGDQFLHDDEDTDANVKCVGCGREYTRDELVALNDELIAANVEEVKAEIVADFRATLRDTFKGSKFIKVR